MRELNDAEISNGSCWARDGDKLPAAALAWFFDDMREVNGFFLFELGGVAMLSLLPPDADLRPLLQTISKIRADLENFASTRENQGDLPRSVDDARDLIRLLDEIIAQQPIPSLTKERLGQLVYRLVTFRDRLSGDLGHIHSFVLEEKGGRSVETLWTRAAERLISSDIVPALSDFTVENINEAAKCWAVDRPTAVGFHMMRSVEGVLRLYKKLITGQEFSRTDKRGTTQYQGFGALVRDLDAKLEELKRSKSSFGRLELALGILRPLRRLYRDPLSHPELKHLEEGDATLAFDSGLSAISTMVQDALDGGAHFAIAYQADAKF